jgi:hypothetical protein
LNRLNHRKEIREKIFSTIHPAHELYSRPESSELREWAVREIGLSISTVRSGKIAEQAIHAAITVRMFALPPRDRTSRYLLGAVSPIAPYLSAISLQENHFHFHVGAAGLGLTVLPTRIS